MQEAPAIEGADDFADVEADPPRGRRRSLRRAVSLDCSLESDVWEGAVVLAASDVSNEGLWIESPYALGEGEELVVSFTLPGGEPGKVWAIAEVARVGLWRRRSDARASGMGLVFTYCSAEDRARLRGALRGRPPPLPLGDRARRSRPPPLPSQRTAAREQSGAGQALCDEALPAVLDWLLASD